MVQTSSQTAKKWPANNAIIVSNTHNIHTTLGDSLRPLGWKISAKVDSVENAVKLIEQAQAFMIILDDSLQEPIQTQLSYLLKNPITSVTPIFAIMNEKSQEDQILKNFGRFEVIKKPLTNGQILPRFTALLSSWETQTFSALRMATFQYINKKNEIGITNLLKLNQIPELSPIISRMIALIYIEKNDPLNAEKILLDSLKKFPLNFTLIFSLANFYMQFAMPKLAQRLFYKLKDQFGYSEFIIPGLVQSTLLLNDLETAYTLLLEIYKKEIISNQTINFLGRVMLALGKNEEFNNISNEYTQIKIQISKNWEMENNKVYYSNLKIS